MTAEQALGKAAELVEARGLARLRLMDRRGRVCLNGALWLALGADASLLKIGAPKALPQHLRPTIRAVCDAVRMELGLSLATPHDRKEADWSNAKGRTKEEVATVFRNAKRWLT